MDGILYAITFLGGCFGLFLVISAFTTASGAPQEAALAALGVACAAIPYCMARAVQELKRK